MTIHILRPRGDFLGQVRYHGHRKWITLPGRYRTSEGAIAAAVKGMGSAKAARALFIDRCGYYEPHVSAEVHTLPRARLEREP